MENPVSYYFAYGSNLSLLRLQNRVPSVALVGRFFLPKHRLMFHKHGKDGSAKCDAYFTGKDSDRVLGLLYVLDEEEKQYLDLAEGLGNGYEEKEVDIFNDQGKNKRAFTYYATHINKKLAPFSWYVNHVLRGAESADFPSDYLKEIKAIEAVDDFNKERDALERSIY